MARDYAASNRRRTKAPAGLPGWVWLTAGLSIGLVIAVIVYIGRPAQPMPSVTARQQQTRPAAPAKPRVVVPPVEDPEFDFYRLLEGEQEIGPSVDPPPRTKRPPPVIREQASPAAAEAVPEPEPPPAEDKPAPAPETRPPAPSRPAGTSERYIVLAGSFKNPEYAERHKASLALAGIESQIETVSTGDHGTFHRVRIGPRDSLAAAEAVMRQLRINGFDGRVIRQR